MKIGLDFDGVISHVGALKASATKKMFGKEVEPHKFDRDHVIENDILTHEEYEQLKTFIYTDPDSEPHMIEVPGAIGGVKKLLKDGHDVCVITLRDGVMVDLAKRWISGHGLGDLPIIGVGFEAKKDEAAHGLDVFCDDLLLHLYHLKDVVPYRFLFSWDYNKKWDEKEYAKRIYSWDELYLEICKIKI